MTEAAITCEGCGKQYRWKAQLAGKKVKCGCGATIHVAVEPPVIAEEPAISQEEEVYVPPPLPRGPISAANAQAAETGGPAVAPGAPESMPWVFRRKGLTAEAPVEEKPSPLRDFVLPIILIPIGVILSFYAEMHAKDQVSSAAHVAPVVISGMIMSTALMIGGMFLASAMGGVAFPDKIPVMMLKVCAIALIPGAVGQILDPMVGGINGNIVSALASLALYFGLFAMLFKLPAQDMVICVMMFWIIRVGIAYAMFRFEEYRSGSWI